MTHRQIPDLQKLKNERRHCQRELERVEAAIQKLEGSRRSSRRSPAGRGSGNPATLGDAIARVLAKATEPVPIAEIVSQIQASGYRSNSSQFRNLVNLTLVKDQRFRRSGRGRYVLEDAGDEVRSHK